MIKVIKNRLHKQDRSKNLNKVRNLAKYNKIRKSNKVMGNFMKPKITHNILKFIKNTKTKQSLGRITKKIVST